jgi:hypothetical protein
MTTQQAWTVGTLRAAITGLPDDTPLVISAEDFDDPGLVVEQVIVGAGLSTVGRSNGHGPGQGKAFALDCEIPDGPIELRAGRARALTTHEPLTRQRPHGPSRQPSPRPDRETEAEP